MIAPLVHLTGCRPDEPPAARTSAVPVAWEVEPALVANPLAGGTAWLDAALAAPRALRVTVEDDARRWQVDLPVGADHHALIAGFRPGVTHAVTVEALDDRGRVAASAERAWAEGPLPAGFPTWELHESDRERIEPGVTLVGFASWLVAIDGAGWPVWWLPAPGAVHQVGRAANGALLAVINRQLAVEFDLSGAASRAWRPEGFAEPADAVPVAVEALHHDLVELPNGDLLALSIERRWIEDYPSSETDPDAPTAPAWVAGDVVVELDPGGAVVGSWALLDLLEPRRIGYDAVDGGYWEDFPPWVGDDVKDWSHGNALAYDPATDTILVGLRHQDAVVGIDHGTGALAWVVAPPSTWPPRMDPWVLTPDGGAPESALPYHPHGARFRSDGRISLFDNGNGRASPFADPLPDAENYSRALELELDLSARRWRRTWSWGEDLDPARFAGSLGDVDELPLTGDRLVTFGNVADPAQGGVRIVEVTEEGDVVWDLEATDPDATTFRAERIAGLLPDG